MKTDTGPSGRYLRIASLLVLAIVSVALLPPQTHLLLARATYSVFWLTAALSFLGIVSWLFYQHWIRHRQVWHETPTLPHLIEEIEHLRINTLRAKQALIHFQHQIAEQLTDLAAISPETLALAERAKFTSTILENSYTVLASRLRHLTHWAINEAKETELKGSILGAEPSEAAHQLTKDAIRQAISEAQQIQLLDGPTACSLTSEDLSRHIADLKALLLFKLTNTMPGSYNNPPQGCLSTETEQAIEDETSLLLRNTHLIDLLIRDDLQRELDSIQLSEQSDFV